MIAYFTLPMIRYDSILRARVPKLKGTLDSLFLRRAFCVEGCVASVVWDAMNQAQVASDYPTISPWAEVSGAAFAPYYTTTLL